MEKRKPSDIAGENVSWCSLKKPQKTKKSHHMIQDHVSRNICIHIHTIYLEKTKALIEKIHAPQLLIAALFIAAQTWKQQMNG